MPPEILFDYRQLDFSRPVVDLDEIRKVNPQRFEMEQLTAIVYIDRQQHLAVGYKDVGHDEFWIRGHMPDHPLMPGVMMCEAAAQLAGYYCRAFGIIPSGQFLAFGGMENVRFRGPVYPGDRLVLVAKAVQIHRRRVHSTAQGFVGDNMVFQGDIIGMPFTPRREG